MGEPLDEVAYSISPQRVFTMRLAARNPASVREFHRAAIVRNQNAATAAAPHIAAIHPAQFNRVAPERPSPAPDCYGIIAAALQAALGDSIS